MHSKVFVVRLMQNVNVNHFATGNILLCGCNFELAEIITIYDVVLEIFKVNFLVKMKWMIRYF